MSTPQALELGFAFPAEAAEQYLQTRLGYKDPDFIGRAVAEYREIAGNLAQLDGQTVTVIDKELRPQIHDSAMMGLLRAPYIGFSPERTTFVTDGFVGCEDLDHLEFRRYPGEIYSPYAQITYSRGFRKWAKEEKARLAAVGLDDPIYVVISSHTVVTPSIVLLGNEQLRKYMAQIGFPQIQAPALKRMATMLGVELG